MSCRSAIASLLVALAASACDRTGQPEQASPTAPTSGEVTAGEVAPGAAAAPAGKLDRSHKGETPPADAFADPSGKRVTLADFKGKPVLLNLWATWCGPCVKELPTLDTLARAGGVTVLAVSQDTTPAKVAPFLAERKLTALKPYVDDKMALSVAYQADLPTTILIGADGRELWRRSGGFDWTSAEAKALIAEAR